MTTPTAASAAVRLPSAILFVVGLLAVIALVGIIVLLLGHDQVPTELWTVETTLIGGLLGIALPRGAA